MGYMSDEYHSRSIFILLTIICLLTFAAAVASVVRVA